MSSKMDIEKVLKAAERNDLEEVKRHLEGNDVSPVVKTELVDLATKKKNLDLFKCIVENDRSIVKEDRNQILLYKAVKYGSLDIVRYLVEKHKMNIFHRYSDKLTPSVFHLAIKRDHLHILKYFIEKRKANANEPVKRRRPLLHEALLCKRNKIIQYLVKNKDIKLSLLDLDGESVIDKAALSGNLAFLKYVLDERKVKIDINNRNRKSGSTLVMEIARQSEHFDILQYLVDQKHANINILDKNNNTILSCTRSKNFCEYLVQKGADINWKDGEGNTPLYYSIDHNCYGVMECLVENGADVNHKNNCGMTLLNLIIAKDPKKWRIYDICNYLIEHKADINLADNFGHSPLHTVIIGRNLNFTCDTELCEYLIEHGANVNQENDKGKTPLEYAVIYNRYEICKILVERNANVNHRNIDGETPVHRAVMSQRKMNILEYLVGEHHADINIARKCDNMTPLHIAASKNHTDICKYLIKQGANIRATDKDGKTPKERALDENLIKYMEAVFVSRNRRSVDFQSFRFVSLRRISHDDDLQKMVDCISHQGVKHKVCKGNAAHSGVTYNSYLKFFFIFTQVLLFNVENLIKPWTLSFHEVNLSTEDA